MKRISGIRLILVGLLCLSIPWICHAQGRILMIDSIVDSSVNVSYRYHKPKNYDHNPVLKADKYWELNANGDPYAAPFSGGVWYDETDSLYKMWYSAGGEKKHGLITCLALSTDGKQWEKPALDVVEVDKYSGYT